MSQAGVMLPEEFAGSFFREIQSRIKGEYYTTWFTRARVKEVNAQDLVLAVESVFMRDWIQRRYLAVLEASAKAVDGVDRKIFVSIDPPAGQAETAGQAASAVPEPNAARPEPARQARVMGTPLNRGLTFDNFVVGTSNSLPCAAAKAVAEKPGHAYNPLFIHGSVGLGKTHLLQAICHEILGRDGSTHPFRIQYISCETFINQFISSIQVGDLDSFRHRYRNSDILIIDDIHLLAHKERTQEEFFHTFNHLVNAGKQVVFSSDSPPQDIPSLQERLVSRFKMGLVGELELPDLETRIAIVQHKARIRGAGFAHEVAAFIAEQVKTNIRELEGAVIEVIGYSALNDGRPIDLELARQALRPIVPAGSSRAVVTMQDIFGLIQAYFGVSLKEIQSKKRTQTISMARHVAMYLARTYTRHSLQEIGGYLGGKDHSSVLYALKKVGFRMRSEQKYRESIDDLTSQLLGGRQ